MHSNRHKWNNRKVNDNDRMVEMIKTIEGKRLTYKQSLKGMIKR